MIRKAVHFLDERTNQTGFINKALRYVFPDHWSFLLGEVALYCFMLLVATGTYLALFFDDSVSQTTYHGPYKPLDGATMSHAYESVVHLSFSVKAGLLIRQTHHWAADVFVVAIVLHLMRVFFTGAYRKPRGITYTLGIGILTLALLEGYMGYSLVDDLLSGMGLAIGYSVALSIPFFGENFAALIWGGPFPGAPSFWPRMFIAHVFIFPLLIAILLGAHLTLVASRHHTQFRRSPKQSERKLLGVPTFPGQTPRSLGLMLATFALLFLLGGLVQINPIWLWGPYHVGASTNGAQPDWYLGFLIGALRLVPGFDVVIDGYTLVPNPFWGGVGFPTVVFGFLAVWPMLERWKTGDHRFHNIADRPRDAPWRTGIGAAVIAWVFLVFWAGAADRIYVFLGFSYVWQIWIYRVGVWVVPVLVCFGTRWVCEELRKAEPLLALQEAAEEAAKTQTDTAVEVEPAR